MTAMNPHENNNHPSGANTQKSPPQIKDFPDWDLLTTMKACLGVQATLFLIGFLIIIFKNLTLTFSDIDLSRELSGWLLLDFLALLFSSFTILLITIPAIIITICQRNIDLALGLIAITGLTLRLSAINIFPFLANLSITWL